jgi:hypothetical protein
MDPDPTPDPTPFFSHFQDAKEIIFFSILTRRHIIFSLKNLVFAKIIG